MEEQHKPAGENPEQDASNPNEERTGPRIHEELLKQYLEKLRREQNFPMGLAAGIMACLAGAALWAVVTVNSGYQIGYMAIALGLLVGYAIRYAGKGLDPIYGYVGGFLAFIGCILGNVFSLIGFLAQAEGLGYFQTLTLMDYSIIPELMVISFSPIDLIFYGIAIYEGYNFAFRQISEEEIIENATLED